MDELEWQPGLDAAAIGVSVDGGMVTLTGQVSSLAQKWEAERGGFVAFVTRGKASQREKESNECAQIFRGGIALATFPLLHATPAKA